MSIIVKLVGANPWATIGGALLTVVAGYFISSLLKKWAQKYADAKASQADQDAKAAAATQAAADQAASDALKNIDGR